MSIETLNAVEPVLSLTPLREYHQPAGGVRLPRCYGFRLTNPKAVMYAVLTNNWGAPVGRKTIRDGTWYPGKTGPWWIETWGDPAGDPSLLACDVEIATALDDKPPATTTGSQAGPIEVTLSGQQVQVAADPTISKVYGTPVAGAAGSIVLDGTDKQVATVAARQLQLTAVDGDAFIAIDGDSTFPVNRLLILMGTSIMLKAGLALHATQGPAVGGTLYYAQLA